MESRQDTTLHDKTMSQYNICREQNILPQQLTFYTLNSNDLLAVMSWDPSALQVIYICIV